VALAGVLEAAALALRSGRGLIGNGASDVIREIWKYFRIKCQNCAGRAKLGTSFLSTASARACG
jgi:hypothetical protein